MSRSSKRAASASSERRNRYNYKYDRNAEDSDKDFVASPLADNDDKDIGDIKAVKKYNPKSHKKRVGIAKGRGRYTLAIYDKRNSIRYYNKHHSQLSTKL